MIERFRFTHGLGSAEMVAFGQVQVCNNILSTRDFVDITGMAFEPMQCVIEVFAMAFISDTYVTFECK